MLKGKCKHCTKEFEAFTEGQLTNMMLTHQIHKHPETLEVIQKKEEDKELS